jgi:hypothetical protein
MSRRRIILSVRRRRHTFYVRRREDILSLRRRESDLSIFYLIMSHMFRLIFKSIPFRAYLYIVRHIFIFPLLIPYSISELTFLIHFIISLHSTQSQSSNSSDSSPPRLSSLSSFILCIFMPNIFTFLHLQIISIITKHIFILFSTIFQSQILIYHGFILYFLLYLLFKSFVSYLNL